MISTNKIQDIHSHVFKQGTKNILEYKKRENPYLDYEYIINFYDLFLRSVMIMVSDTIEKLGPLNNDHLQYTLLKYHTKNILESITNAITKNTIIIHSGGEFLAPSHNSIMIYCHISSPYEIYTIQHVSLYNIKNLYKIKIQRYVEDIYDYELMFTHNELLDSITL